MRDKTNAIWQVEYFRLKTGGVWDTAFITLPGTLEEDEIEGEMRIACNYHRLPSNIIRIGIYHYRFCSDHAKPEIRPHNKGIVMYMTPVEPTPRRTQIKDLKDGDVAVILTGKHSNMVVQRYFNSLVVLGSAVLDYNNVFCCSPGSCFAAVLSMECRILKSGETVRLF